MQILPMRGSGVGFQAEFRPLSPRRKSCGYPNLNISSGYNIPAMSSWDNIGVSFAAVEEFYQR